MIPLMTLIMSGTNIAITWFGGHYIAEMQLEVGNLIAFMTYAMQILMSFMMLSMILSWYCGRQASADRINEVLNTDSEIKDVPIQNHSKKATKQHWRLNMLIIVTSMLKT